MKSRLMNKSFLCLIYMFLLLLSTSSLLAMPLRVSEEEKQPLIPLKNKSPPAGMSDTVTTYNGATQFSEALPMTLSIWIERRFEHEKLRNVEFSNKSKVYLRNFFPGSHRENIIAGVGIIFGLLTPVSQWNVSKELWSRLFDENIFTGAMGTISSLPIFAFAAKITKDEFLNMLHLLRPRESDKSITEKIKCSSFFANLPVQLFKICGGASSTLGYSYLHYSYYYESMGSWCLVFILPTTITGTLMGYWGLSRNIEMLRTLCGNLFSSKKLDDLSPRERKIIQAKNRLQEIVLYLSSLSYEEIDTIMRLSGNNFLETIYSALNEKDWPLKRSLYTPSSSLPKRAFQLIGWSVGVLGAWPVQPLTVEGMKVFLDKVGMDDKDSTITSQAFGWYSYLTVASLLSYPSYKIFGEFYNKFCNDRVKNLFTIRAIKNGIYAVIAGLSSAPRVEITFQYVSSDIMKPIIVACVAMGRLALNYFGLINFFKFSSATELKRRALIQIFEKMETLLPQVKEDLLDVFLEFFSAPQRNESQV